MAALLSVRRQRTVSRVLMVHMLMLLVTQVVAFSWNGVYKSVPSSSSFSSSSPSQSVAYSGWQPETFWWRSRRRNSSPAIKADVSVGVSFGQKNSHHPAISQRSGAEEGSFLNLDNSIATMGQPALAAPRLEKDRVGWGFLPPVHEPMGSPSRGLQSQPPHYVSLHYSTPTFGPLGAMNRRNKLNNVKNELDQEVMKNVIKQVLNEERHHEGRLPIKTPAAVLPRVLGASAPVAPAQLGLASGHLVPGHTITRQNPKSPSQGSSHAQTYSVPSGFGDTFLPVQDSFSDGFSSLGFGSMVEPAADFSGGFGQPVMAEAQGQKDEVASHFGGGGNSGGHSALGFGGFGQVDTAVGQFGWREPQSVGSEVQKASPAVIKPIPTAMPAARGAFSQENKDCDSILTKSCTEDSGCQCYGFYFCNKSGKCEDITSSASPDGSAAMTFGEKWHDGPAQTLGLTGRR